VTHTPVIRIAVLCLLLLAGGCSTGPQPLPQDVQPPLYTPERLLPPGFEDPAATYDPWEGMNKRIYNFN